MASFLDGKGMPAWNICVAIIRPRLIFGIAILLTRIIVYRIADFHNRELRIMKFKLGKYRTSSSISFCSISSTNIHRPVIPLHCPFSSYALPFASNPIAPPFFMERSISTLAVAFTLGIRTVFQFTCIDHLFQQSHRINIRTFIHEYFCNLTDTTKRKPPG